MLGSDTSSKGAVGSAKQPGLNGSSGSWFVILWGLSLCMGFRVWVMGFRVWAAGCWFFGFMAWGLGLRFMSGFRV